MTQQLDQDRKAARAAYEAWADTVGEDDIFEELSLLDTQLWLKVAQAAREA